jgi:rRNA-processing protein FCF1
MIVGKNKSMKILLDTNFLLYCAKQKIDYSEVSGEFFVISTVIDELEKLKKVAKKEEDRKSAELALKMLEKEIKEGRVTAVKTRGKADKLIVDYVDNIDAVATMDRELKGRLKGKARIMTIRGKKEIELL